MPKRSFGRVSLETNGWEVSAVTPRGVRRGAAPADEFIGRLTVDPRLAVEQELTATPSTRRAAAVPMQLSVEGEAGQSYVVVVRHPSGAITFHPPYDTQRGRRGGKPSTTVRFSINAPAAAPPQPGVPARRGLFSKVVKVFVLKIAGVVADKTLQKLAEIWESAHWKKAGRHTGWVHASAEELQQASLPQVKDFGILQESPARNLLLIHGTFSNAEGAFASLASAVGSDGQNFFSSVRPIYGDRIFAFNHFTVSQTPEKNALDLLSALPDRQYIFDVITHSRGGLVLRNLVERAAELGKPASRFELGRAVLVACPNEGTALASPARWETMVGWIANLMDLFPDNPFTFGIEFVTEALVWIAQRVGGALPGIAAMNVDSPDLQELQSAPGPPDRDYSALVANFEPDQSLLSRMVDAGVDAFFGSANDLVVPSEGGWRVDPAGPPKIPGDQIGCFGPGGNLVAAGNGVVHHLNFFSRPETVDFVVRTLRGDPQPLTPQDPAADLPFRGRRRAAVAAAAPAPARPRAEEPTPPVAARPAAISRAIGAIEALPSEELQLFVLSADSQTAGILATFRNARVLERFATKGNEAGRRWQKIIAMQQRILSYIDGKPDARELPQEGELTDFGALLFETIFPPAVRRLYDVARAAQQGKRLDIVFTSMIDWVADKPWEFAFDPARKSFLATEEVNFVRNVLTSVPADRINPRPGPLRILVVGAQPIGAGALSTDDEIAVIKRGFSELIEAGLAEVEVTLAATPEVLHQRLEAASERPFDVLHFVGHGEYDDDTKTGYLMFEDDSGAAQRVDAKVLRQIVRGRDIRLVFLNACETGTGGRADFNRGVAPALMTGGVPSLVANQYKVLDPSATAFARHFYWSLAQGRSLGDAAREARVAVNYSITGEAIDWAVPVVFARNPADRLCPPSAATVVNVMEAASATARRVRRAINRYDSRIGLWDVNHIVPSLEQLAERMTRAQDYYAFDMVDISAPLGTWRLERGKEGQEARGFLHGAKVAKKLHQKPHELGVDRLFCITSFWLGDDGYRDLYVWDLWDDDPEEKIAIFSLAGLIDEIREQGFSLERALVNMVVGSLAAISSHRRGPKTCPLYFNNERDVRYIAGPLKFDKICRKKLAKNKRMLEAAEKLLELQ